MKSPAGVCLFETQGTNAENELSNEGGLPEGWALTSVADLTVNHDGRRVPIKSADRAKRPGKFPYFGASGVIDSIDDFLFEGDFLLIAEDGANLLSRSTPIAVRASGRFWVNNHAHVVQPTEATTLEFLKLFFDGSDLQEFVTGTAQPKLTQAALNRIVLPLPPLAEQKRIAAKVEAVLAKVNSARQRLAKVPAILKRFRQSVLAAACSGRLTEDWRGTTDGGGELPTTWKRMQLSELCSSFDYGSSSKSAPSGDVPVLRMGNLQNGEIDWNDLLFTSEPVEIAKYALSPRTVLFNRTNSPELVGKTAIYRGGRPAIFAGYLIRIVHGTDLDPEYLNYCLNSPEFEEYRSIVKTDGVSQSNINARKLAAFELPWCPLPEQHEIVRRVSALFALANKVESRLAAATVSVERVTRAVLAKAFRGELVDTEASLARREGREYESAAKLLERVRSLRTASELATRRAS